jgi:acetylornithine deacetylase/succinyl-diaminopimelate desuccinylase-like protein
MSGDRDFAIANAARYFDVGGFERELAPRIAIRTESQVPDNITALTHYLDEAMIPEFERLGFTCKVFNNPVHGHGPVLLASRIENDGVPTLLGYGHGDVIVGQEDQWQHGDGPWKLRRDQDRLYGRGTADNKGQHTINMVALRFVLEQRGCLGFNAKFIIEMGEEAGSPGLREIIAQHTDEFAADVFIASDGPRVNPDLPTITLGCRGAKNFDLLVELRNGAHHSGNWGGLISDPAIILSNVIASIVNDRGHIQIPEWRAPTRTAAVKQALQNVQVSGGAEAPEINSDWGEPDATPAEKVYSGNSFAVLAMQAGNIDNPVNAITPVARAHCQLRFFAGTPSQRIIPALREHLDAHGFNMVTIDANPALNGAAFDASRTEPDNAWVEKVKCSILKTHKAEPVVLPSMGGSICNDLFSDILGLPTIWIPHSYTGCSQHAPDEHLLRPLCRSALEIMTGLYWDLGAD